MAITSYSITRSGTITIVTVVSDLGGTVYYHWYLDGAYIGRTMLPERAVAAENGEQCRVVVQDTTDAAYDPIANAPDGWPARRELFWTRTPSTDVDYYRIDQKKGAGSWSEIGRVFQDATRWSHWFLTPRLEDLSTYTWRIVPVDAAGNDGTALTIGPELIVRTPDAPDFTVSIDAGTTRVTFTEAA